MTRSAQAISTHMTDFPGNRAAKARVARCQGRAEVTDAEDPLAKIKLHRRRPVAKPTDGHPDGLRWTGLAAIWAAVRAPGPCPHLASQGGVRRRRTDRWSG